MATIIDFYSDLDLHDGQLKNAKIEQLASPPQNPETSRIYFNTTDSKFYGYNGLEWKLLEAKIEPLVGTSAPTTIPVFLGQEYLDTTNKKMYKAFGETASTDWVLLN